MPSAIRNWRPSRPRLRPAKETAHYRSADWKVRRLAVLVRDAYTCRDCSAVCVGKDAHVDHVIPLEAGGGDDFANLCCRCAACHGRKTRAEQRGKGLL
jgi:5-methylcytosine-specific restriction endonuclease McrA